MSVGLLLLLLLLLLSERHDGEDRVSAVSAEAAFQLETGGADASRDECDGSGRRRCCSDDCGESDSQRSCSEDRLARLAEDLADSECRFLLELGLEVLETECPFRAEAGDALQQLAAGSLLASTG